MNHMQTIIKKTHAFILEKTVDFSQKNIIMDRVFLPIS